MTCRRKKLGENDKKCKKINNLNNKVNIVCTV